MENWNNNYENGYGYPTAVQAENEMSLKRYMASVMRRVYGKMTMGLLVTALVSFLVVSSQALVDLIFESSFIFYGLIFAELGLVIYLSARIDKMSSTAAAIAFYAYSALNGITLAPIFFIYTGASIAMTFAITAGTFGAMTLFGYVTRQDLSKIGSFLFMALIGLILCSLVNLFMHNSMLDLCISAAGVLIFVGLTAWDTQAIKRMCEASDSTMVGKVATMGALTLYLDFINLFLYLLRFFGRRS